MPAIYFTSSDPTEFFPSAAPSSFSRCGGSQRLQPPSRRYDFIEALAVAEAEAHQEAYRRHRAEQRAELEAAAYLERVRAHVEVQRRREHLRKVLIERAAEERRLEHLRAQQQRQEQLRAHQARAQQLRAQQLRQRQLQAQRAQAARAQHVGFAGLLEDLFSLAAYLHSEQEETKEESVAPKAGASQERETASQEITKDELHAIPETYEDPAEELPAPSTRRVEISDSRDPSTSLEATSGPQTDAVLEEPLRPSSPTLSDGSSSSSQRSSSTRRPHVRDVDEKGEEVLLPQDVDDYVQL